MYEWRNNVEADEWNHNIASYQGHPLQSAAWGQAKITCGSTSEHRWAAYKNGTPVFFARFEEKRIFPFFKVAWCPRGPVCSNDMDESSLYNSFFKELKKQGYILCVTNPWKPLPEAAITPSDFYTIWIDLTQDKEALWGNLHKKCRSDINRAKKMGLVIEQTTKLDDLDAFFTICESISKDKGFKLAASRQLMGSLLFTPHDAALESVLFAAKHQDQLCGGAFIVRCGENIHYIWGAVNRAFSHLCAGEALQWHIIEWAKSKGCKKYDLEGISAAQTGGVDKFKKRLGGKVVVCHGLHMHPLYFRRLLTWPATKIYQLMQLKFSQMLSMLIPHKLRGSKT